MFTYVDLLIIAHDERSCQHCIDTIMYSLTSVSPSNHHQAFYQVKSRGSV